MKRLAVIFSLCVAMSMTFLAGATAKALKGESNTPYGSYTITLVSNESGSTPVYELKYANSSKTFTVKVCQEKKCCNYVVYGEKMEMMYTCSKGIFGARRIDKKLSRLPQDQALNDINREAFYRQKVLATDGPQTTGSALGLIACYLPEIVG